MKLLRGIKSLKLLIAMDGAWLRSTLFLLLLVIMKMQSSSGQPSIGLQGQVQNLMNVSILRLQLGVDFFVAIQTFLQQKATSQHFRQERVSSATSNDISPDSVHINSDSTHQGKHQAPQFLFNQTTVQTVNKPRENDVEYELLHSFEYSEKYELKSGSKSVKGRLKLHSEFWENTIRANSFILDVVKEGYKILFMAQTTPVLLKNNASAIKHRAFVTTAINEFVRIRLRS